MSYFFVPVLLYLLLEFTNFFPKVTINRSPICLYCSYMSVLHFWLRGCSGVSDTVEPEHYN